MVGRSDVGWVPEFGGAKRLSEVGGRIDLPGSRRADGVSGRGTGRLHSGLGHPTAVSGIGFRASIRWPTSDLGDIRPIRLPRADAGWAPEFGGAKRLSEVGGRIDLPGGRRADGVSGRGTGRLYSGLGYPTAGSGLRFRARIRCPVSDVRLRKSPTHPTPRGEKAKNPDQPSCRGSKTATRAVIGTLRPTERRRACLVYTGRCRVFHRHASAGFVTNRFPFRNPEA